LFLALAVGGSLKTDCQKDQDSFNQGLEGPQEDQ
jgi:hypothetical protein